MRGNPKFKKGDKVRFTLMDETYEGIIAIIDVFGTFFEPDDVSYDVLVKADKYKSESNPEGECFMKHITEQLITKIK